MKTIAFQVTDATAEELARHSVWLDVFGTVRWNKSYGDDCPVMGATQWQIIDAESV